MRKLASLSQNDDFDSGSTASALAGVSTYRPLHSALKVSEATMIKCLNVKIIYVPLTEEAQGLSVRALQVLSGF